jgi:hypothetical protein
MVVPRDSALLIVDMMMIGCKVYESQKTCGESVNMTLNNHKSNSILMRSHEASPIKDVCTWSVTFIE